MLASVLKEWKLACPITELGLVFQGGTGKVLVISSLRDMDWIPFMQRIGLAKDDGLPKYHFHALRHCAASLFIEQGLEPK